MFPSPFTSISRLIEVILVPWKLYHKSRARLRRDRAQRIQDTNAEFALSELHTYELFYLACTVVAPFIGAVSLLAGLAAGLPRPDSAVGQEVAVSAPDGIVLSDTAELAS